MKTQVIRDGNKVIVKFAQAEPSKKTMAKWERKLGVTLSYCDFRDDKLILWNGPSNNVRFAGWTKIPKRLRTDPTGFSFRDAAGHGRMTSIAKTLQSRYSKIRYARKWSRRVYESLIRPRSNGYGAASDFNAPTTLP